MNKRERSTPQQFAKEHWKGVLLASSTLAGAAILLLIRYFRQEHAEEVAAQTKIAPVANIDPLTARELAVLELEAATGRDSTVLLLETGTAAKEVIPNAGEILELLAQGITDKQAQDILRTLRGVR